jgi:hypothetical protein
MEKLNSTTLLRLTIYICKLQLKNENGNAKQLHLPCSYMKPSILEHPGPPLSHRSTGSMDELPSDSTK